MGYLFLQTWLWILFAGLLGLFVGWWIWGKRSEDAADDLSGLKRKLAQCEERCAELETLNGSSGPGHVSSATDTEEDVDTRVVADSEDETSKIERQLSSGDQGNDPDQYVDAEIQDHWCPEGLSDPDGEADDLKRIRGVGPVIERTLNDLGIYHFHQVAGFSDENIMWVDNHISFQGRIVRENWVGQAKLLADGEDTGFSSRYDRGNKGK